MKNLNTKKIFYSILTLTLFGFVLAEKVDYLEFGETLKFNNKEFDITWSSHPNDHYYKQEYLPKGETLENYNEMILVEAVHGDISLRDGLDAKAAELNERKKWDFVANYQVYENENIPNEGIIDFVVSDTNTRYEWNLYRFQKQKHALVLFAYSYKAILNDDNDLKKFFTHIKKNKSNMINRLTSYEIPETQFKR
jgi:hypothetical protein